ncbi:MAG: radical SAM protein [Caldilineaceae bacterium]
MASSDTPRPASTALHPTGGFLTGFTHSLQPYIGCRFGCAYCYVRESNVHRFFNGGFAWGEYAFPRQGVDEKLAQELACYQRKGQLDSLSIFCSSSTDPYQGAEREWELTRRCLQAFVERPPGLLVVQTRGPLVRRDFDLLAALGRRCWLSMTLETDRDEVRRALTPRCPSVHQRVQTIRAARDAGLNVQVAVSPCLPYSTVDEFGSLLAELGQRVVVDSYISGDGQGGKRTARTAIPAEYARLGWGAWQGEEAARALYRWLHQRMGEQAGWSQAGFTHLADRQSTGQSIHQ